MVVVNVATTILITSSLRCLIRDFWLLCSAFRKVDNQTATFVKFCSRFASVSEPVSEPKADRGPRAGSPRGVVVATGSQHPTRLLLEFL